MRRCKHKETASLGEVLNEDGTVREIIRCQGCGLAWTVPVERPESEKPVSLFGWVISEAA